jgi:hypothetical protein
MIDGIAIALSLTFTKRHQLRKNPHVAQPNTSTLSDIPDNGINIGLVDNTVSANL